MKIFLSFLCQRMRLVGIKKWDFCWDQTQCRSTCSWFGFKLTVKQDAPFTRTQLAQELDKYCIGNRMLFGGNLVKQPAFVNIKNNNNNAFRVPNKLDGSDLIMNNTLFLGVYPGLTEQMLDKIVQVISHFCDAKQSQ